jgi:hypothetical protein
MLTWDHAAVLLAAFVAIALRSTLELGEEAEEALPSPQAAQR